MVYLIDSFDFDLIDITKGGEFMNLTMWETTEDRVKRIIANERCRSIFSRTEIINIFKAGKIQMVRCNRFTLKPFDRIVVWTETNRYFIIEITGFDNTNEKLTGQIQTTNRTNKKQSQDGEFLARRIEVVEEGVEYSSFRNS